MTKKQPYALADQISKRFYGTQALDKVSIAFNAGEVHALVGENGAGKSTTMKLLTGYLSPSEGVARIAGHDMATDRIAGARRLGYLPENGPLYAEMTPHGLLSFFADARGMSAERKEERIRAVVDLCGLAGVVFKPISKLSKGYRQRVGMAQTLLHEPDVLIMDEPNNSMGCSFRTPRFYRRGWAASRPDARHRARGRRSGVRCRAALAGMGGR